MALDCRELQAWMSGKQQISFARLVADMAEKPERRRGDKMTKLVLRPPSQTKAVCCTIAFLQRIDVETATAYDAPLGSLGFQLRNVQIKNVSRELIRLPRSGHSSSIQSGRPHSTRFGKSSL